MKLSNKNLALISLAILITVFIIFNISSDNSTTDDTVCSGIYKLTLVPSTTTPGSSVRAATSNLTSACAGRTSGLYTFIGEKYKLICVMEIKASGGGACTFMINQTGKYQINAYVDHNFDGIFGDPGEHAVANLLVQ